ncbi:MAG: cell wall-binding repeat-containing protein [Coriobacteriales bacterium]|jgi:glycerophosphoryl diester phosphodiesterase
MTRLPKIIAVLVLAMLFALPIALAPAQAQGATYTLQASSSNSAVVADDTSPTQLVSWTRVSGKTQYDTMRAITMKGWKSSKYAVVVTSEGFADALSASSLAGKLSAPILLVEHNRVPWQTRLELERMKVQTVYVVGGVKAVNNNVFNRLKQLGPKNVYRVWGYTAQDTAVMVSTKLGKVRSDTCFLATSSTFSDALAASPYAARNKAPIFLAGRDGRTISYFTLNAIKRGGYKNVIVVGGPKAISNGVFNLVKGNTKAKVKRVYGANSYKTAIALAKWEIDNGMSPEGLLVARGTRYSDALCAGPWAARGNTVLLLISEKHRSDAVNFCKANRVLIGDAPNKHAAYVLGGTRAISKAGFKALQDATTKPVPSPAPWTHVYSHRGSATDSIEHTFAAYDMVKRQGSRNLELDVVRSKNGTLYVSHDLNARRVFGVNRAFGDMTDEEINALRASNGEPPHTFEAVLNRYGTSVNYVVELKEGMGGFEEFVRVVDAHPAANITVQSFSTNPLEALESTHPAMKKVLLVDYLPISQQVFNHGLTIPCVDFVAAYQNLMTEENVKVAHKAGKKVAFYTLDTDDAIKKAIALNVDAYFTNHTARALQLERAYRGEKVS